MKYLTVVRNIAIISSSFRREDFSSGQGARRERSQSYVTDEATKSGGKSHRPNREVIIAAFLKAGFFLSLFFLLANVVQAQKTMPKPTGYLVNDFAGLMSRAELEQLGAKLSAYARETSTQIVVVTETSLEGEDDFDYSVRLARAWGIGGSKEKSNGILLYIAKEERKVRIQTGYGAEGFLTDALSRRIIEQIISPAFKEGNYYAGIDGATTAIMDLGRDEYTNEGGGKRKSEGGKALGLIFMLLLILIIFLSIYNRNRRGRGGNEDDGGYHRGGRYDERNSGGGGWIFFPTGGFGGWGGGGGGSGSSDGWGSSSGGDFGGFGGGDFGGGGAGGDW